MTAGVFAPTRGQAEAIRVFKEFMQTSVAAWQVFSLCGFAGTGKTTLVRHLVKTMQSELGVDAAVRVVAPTGKAASVLRTKGFPDTTTVHALLYEPQVHTVVDDEGHEVGQELVFSLKPVADMENDTRLIVCDEASMVDDEMAGDLRSLGVKILAIGDPFQLPPVRRVDAGEPLLNHARPDAMLTEVTRQALDSPVLHLATVIRERQELLTGWHGDSCVLSRGEASELTITGTAPFIVGLNRTRHAQNWAVRKIIGRAGWEPEVGDRLLCRRNDKRAGLVNGELLTVTETYPVGIINTRLNLKIVNDDGGLCEKNVTAWSYGFQAQDGEDELKRMRMTQRRACQELTYGYALTCHASQGSEWPVVVVINEAGAFGADQWRWLYTAITRASERVAVIT